MTTSSASSSPAPDTGPQQRRTALLTVSWLWVGLPLAYGVYELVLKAKQLFTG
jgi:hypothetical protein